MNKVPGTFERPPNSGIWWISYTDTDGNRRREKAGKHSAALDLLGQRRAQVRKNEFIPPRQKRVWNFHRLATEAIKNKALRLAPLTIETDILRLKKLTPLLGHVRFDRITPQRVEETVGTLRRSGLSPSTCNRYRSFISSVFTFAMNSDRVAANPCTRVKRYKENDARIRWLRDEEEKRLRKAFVADAHEWEFDLALTTGMRRGEQFGLKWKDCDLEHGTLEVKGKTGRRHVEANKDAVAALRRLHKITGEKEFVCPEANDEQMKRDGRRWLKTACEVANVKDFRWHDLRHTFASRLLMEGEDIRTVQVLLGHKSIVMTMKYAHLSKQHLKKAAGKTTISEVAHERAAQFVSDPRTDADEGERSRAAHRSGDGEEGGGDGSGRGPRVSRASRAEDQQGGDDDARDCVALEGRPRVGVAAHEAAQGEEPRGGFRGTSRGRLRS